MGDILRFPPPPEPAPVFLYEGRLDIEREEGAATFNLVLADTCLPPVTLSPYRALMLADMLLEQHKAFQRERGALILRNAVLAAREGGKVAEFPRQPKRKRSTAGEAFVERPDGLRFPIEGEPL